MTPKFDNPWSVTSLYEFQYFNCPSCPLFKVVSKQEFVYHAFNTHPKSIEDLEKISDGSLNDILLPWMPEEDRIKIEQKYNVEDLDYEDKNKRSNLGLHLVHLMIMMILVLEVGNHNYMLLL